MNRIPGEVRAAIAAYERAGHELITAVNRTGTVQLVPDVPEPRDLQRAHVLAGILAEVTRIGVLLTGLAHGGDLAEIHAQMRTWESLGILGDHLVPLVDVRSLPVGGSVTQS